MWLSLQLNLDVSPKQRVYNISYSKPCTFNFGMMNRHTDTSRHRENQSTACLGPNPASPGQDSKWPGWWSSEGAGAQTVPNKSLETIKTRLYRVSGTGHKQKEWCIIIPTRKTSKNNPFTSLKRIKSLKFDFLEAVAICLDEVLKVFHFFSIQLKNTLTRNLC